MPWGRLDDSLYDHPKLDLIPEGDRLAGIGLWARAISWCNRFLTDGLVPRARIEKLDGSLELADHLVAAGLFDPSAHGYQVHDFLEFNDSREQVEERRRKEAERKAEWRRARAEGKRPAGSPNGTMSVDGADVPPVVPSSVPAGQPDDMSRDVSRRDTRARDVARIPTRPVPAHESREKASRSETARGGAQPDRSVVLTKSQLQAWGTFGPEWAEFKAAWLSRGLRFPPAGSSEDDDTSQRGLLYQVLDAQPTNLVRWIREAPEGGARAIIEYVLARWHEVRADAGVADPEEWFALKGQERRDAPERLGSVMARLDRG